MDVRSLLGTEANGVTRSQAQVASATMPPPRPVPDDSGEYLLPVPFSPTQHLLLKAIISSHYSELLAYFSDEDAPDAARTERALTSLGKMAENIASVCIHPALLIDQYMPNNLFSRDSPAALARHSGLFQVLGKLLTLTAELNLQIGIVAKAGKTTDLLEAFMVDKHVNCYRFSGQPLRDFRTQRHSCSTVYLVPSSLQYLSAAINAAFDLMIVVDNTFDLSSDYAHGVRSQLRDPQVRKPMAPVVSLLALNSLMHAQLSSPQIGIEALAATVVFSQRAGEIPHELAPFYDNDLTPLAPWFTNTDAPWPLPRTTQLPSCDHRQVYETLMQTPDVDAANTPVPPHKRTKVEKEDDFTIKLVEQYDKLRAKQADILSELENYRNTATRRENALDDAREEILRLTISSKSRADNNTVSEGKLNRYKAELESTKQLVEQLTTKLEQLSKEAVEADPESAQAKLLTTTKENEELKAENDVLKTKLSTQESMVEVLKKQFMDASGSVSGLNAQIEEQQQEIAVLKEQAAGQFVAFKELSHKNDLKEKAEEIKQLKEELKNLKKSAKELDRESPTSRSGKSRAVRKTNSAASSP